MTVKRITILATLAVVTSPVWVHGETALDNTFTYQGRLRQLGLPVSGNCDFQFSLWDNAFGGTQIGTTQTKTNVVVTNGLFTVKLGFGAGSINGNARWLDISVRCPAGAGAYTPLNPRVELTPAPHALALPGLRTQWVLSSPPGIPSLIGGQDDNTITSGVLGGTISGGGIPNVGGTLPNRVTDDYGTIGGGGGNLAGDDAGTTGDARYGTVAGGRENTASGFYATVGGGTANIASGDEDTVSGGSDCIASGGLSTVGGGFFNVATALVSTIGGGNSNEVSGEAGTIAGGGASDPVNPLTGNRVFDDYGTVGGGGNNRAGSDDGDSTTTTYPTIGGGRNHVASGRFSTIGGGDENTASGEKTTVGGGSFNIASMVGATVGGGLGNNAANGNATVSGGNSNQATGDGATVCGGAGNQASGFRSIALGGLSNAAAGDHSLAAGRRAKANHAGAFVWGDSTDADFASTAPDQFLIRATGNVGIGTNSPTEQLHVAGAVKADGGLMTNEGTTGAGTRMGHVKINTSQPLITTSGGTVSWDQTTKQIKLTESLGGYIHFAGHKNEGAGSGFLSNYVGPSATSVLATLNANGEYLVIDIAHRNGSNGCLHLYCFYDNNWLVANYTYRPD